MDLLRQDLSIAIDDPDIAISKPYLLRKHTLDCDEAIRLQDFQTFRALVSKDGLKKFDATEIDDLGILIVEGLLLALISKSEDSLLRRVLSDMVAVMLEPHDKPLAGAEHLEPQFKSLQHIINARLTPILVLQETLQKFPLEPGQRSCPEHLLFHVSSHDSQFARCEIALSHKLCISAEAVKLMYGAVALLCVSSLASGKQVADLEENMPILFALYRAPAGARILAEARAVAQTRGSEAEVLCMHLQNLYLRLECFETRPSIANSFSVCVCVL